MSTPEVADGVVVKDHVEKDVKDVCAYCGRSFDEREVVVERVIHGRDWRFCNEECLRDFYDALECKEDVVDVDVELNVHVNQE